MTSDAIVTENLTKVYGKLTAVDHVNVKVASGTVFGLLGPNGAGKTTMIKLLTGLTDMTEGEAWVAGFDVRRDPRLADDPLHRGSGRALPADLDYRSRQDRRVRLSVGPQGPSRIGLRRAGDGRGGRRSQAPFDPRGDRGAEPGEDLDPAGLCGRRGPTAHFLNPEDG